MSTERLEERVARWKELSECLFGDAAEVETAEAEELLKAAGIDPQQFKNSLYQRMRERSATYSETGRPLPPLLKQALEDLRPESETTTMSQTARRAIARLLAEIRELPKRLGAGLTPAFTAAYRNKKELSAQGKQVLDEIAEDLRRHIKDRKNP